MTLRTRIERYFGEFAKIIFDNRLKTISILFCLTLFFISYFPQIRIDSSLEGFLHEDSQVLLEYNKYREQFGESNVAMLLIKSKNVFNIKFFNMLRNLHNELEEKVPYVENVRSLINARNTRGTKDELIVEDLCKYFPNTNEQIKVLKKRIMNNPLYENIYISKDGKYTAIIVETQLYSSLSDGDLINEEIEGFKEDRKLKNEYLTIGENEKVVRAIIEIADKYKTKEFQIYIAGTSLTQHVIKTAMIKDSRTFMIYSLIAILVLLYILFRRISGVLLAITPVFLSLLATVGIMAITDIAIKVPTQILPSFLLAVGIGDSVHILVIFFRYYDSCRNKKESIIYSIQHSGLAVFMTSITTACGLLSFSTSEVASTAELGIFAAIGVSMALLYTVVLMPAAISIMPLRPKNRKNRNNTSFLDRMYYKISYLTINHSNKILIASLLIIAVAIIGASKVEFHHDVIGWFPKKMPIRVATEKIDEVMKGSLSIEIIIDTGKENGLYDPNLLKKLEATSEYFESLDPINGIFTRKAWSLADLLKEINKAINEDQDEFYIIPKRRSVIANLLFLFEISGSEDLENFVDNKFSKARFSVRLPFKDVLAYDGFIKKIENHFHDNYSGINFTITGKMAMMIETFLQAHKSMRTSYSYAFIVITGLMILLIGKLKIGLLSMVPNLVPILIMIGIMGWLDMPMDMFTMLVGSIALGIAVDDTIHFMHNFRKYYEQTKSLESAIEETLNSTGRAMFVTTCVLSLGFYTYLFATMNSYFNFGVLIGTTIIIALLADYFIGPSLMVLVYGKKDKENIIMRTEYEISTTYRN